MIGRPVSTQRDIPVNGRTNFPYTDAKTKTNGIHLPFNGEYHIQSELATVQQSLEFISQRDHKIGCDLIFVLLIEFIQDGPELGLYLIAIGDLP